MGEVPVVAEDAEGAHRKADSLDQDVIVPEGFRDLRRGDDGRRRAVGDAAAVEQAQGPGHHGRVDHLLRAHLPLEVGLGAHGPVVVVLGGDLGQGHLPFLIGNLVLMEIAGGGQGELGGRRHRWVDVRAGRFGHGQTGETRVLELLHAHGQHDVIDAGGHGVAGVPEGVGGGGAGVLHPGDGYVVQLERRGQGLAGPERGHGAQPGRLDVFPLQSRVLEGFVGCLDDQVRGAGVPTLAEFAATHADHRNPVLDTAHDVLLILND